MAAQPTSTLPVLPDEKLMRRIPFDLRDTFSTSSLW